MDPLGRRTELGRAAYGNGRFSSQRLAIAAIVDGTASAFSAEELHEMVRRTLPDTGIATIYRAVIAMQEAGFIEKVGVRDGAALFARCRHEGHHHHLVCTSCGSVTEADCPLDTHALGRRADFAITGHSLVVYGVCGGCRR